MKNRGISAALGAGYLVMLASIVLATGCAQHAGAAAATPPPALAVTAVPVRRGDLTSTFELSGTIVPARQADLSSVITGAVVAVNVQIGDRVRAGELLVQIDDSTLRAQLASDQAALAQARARLRQTTVNDLGAAQTTDASLTSAQIADDAAASNLQRNETLFRQGYISQAALDDARSQYAASHATLQSAQVAARSASMTTAGTSAAQADVASMQAAVAQSAAAVQTVEAQIAQAAVEAPFDGIVTQRAVDPGSLASPGTLLVQVSEMDPAYVDVGIPDEDLRYVHTGSRVAARIEAVPGRTWQGAVNNLNAATGQGTLTYLARVALPNPDLTLKAG
ncbi:MAG TPA: efflux RND transporter periplasmic adaptor subunit, partial [Candidatus Eremiobacteraceae bacterium]|nr:efflux RND transporter periplasmic adaptor subunit [Candidatus Eremiobacteraceae bacterium]